MVKKEVMLSTSDNPFNPFINYDEWLAWDQDSGYHTNAYLARIAMTSDSLSDEDNDLAIEQAIDEIINLNITGNYVKITKTD